MSNARLRTRLLIATRNSGKVREFEDLLRPLNLQLLSLDQFEDIVEPDETGTTFRENAEIKASSYARQTCEWALADDSGLSIDALNGKPGVHSARYGGSNASYADKMRSILDEMRNARNQERTARFSSLIVLSDPEGEIRIVAEGICEGTIANEPSGTHGFGYDPIFIPVGHDRTFGEMSDSEKQLLSHRGLAAAQFIREMLDFTGV